MSEEEKIVEEESPQLPAAFGFVEPTAVEQLARPKAVSQRIEDQVLKQRQGDSTARLRQESSTIKWFSGKMLPGSAADACVHFGNRWRFNCKIMHVCLPL